MRIRVRVARTRVPGYVNRTHPSADWRANRPRHISEVDFVGGVLRAWLFMIRPRARGKRSQPIQCSDEHARRQEDTFRETMRSGSGSFAMATASGWGRVLWR
eukprot:2168284-Pleurochrysis_carterae.AAC.2